MPIAGTFDLYDSATHHGLTSSSFVTPFLSMIGMTSGHTNKLWRSKLVEAVGSLLKTPALHKQFATANGEAAMTGLKMLIKLHHDPHPWDDLWRSIVVEHPLRDACGRTATFYRCYTGWRSRSTSAATGKTCRCTCRRCSLHFGV